MGVDDFRDLQCWQLANELKNAVYAFTSAPVLLKDGSFCDDIRRSSRSASANIAEGFGRQTHREFAHVLSIARASLMETENHLEHALACGYITDAEYSRLRTLALSGRKTMARLHSYLTGRPRRRPAP